MAKNTSSLSWRDLAIGALAGGFLLSNYIWYQVYIGQQASVESLGTTQWRHELQIKQLKACLDAGTKPCDLDVVAD